MLPQPAAEFCDLRQTEAKGLGLFAKVDIAKGTVISREVNVKIEIGDHKFSPATLTNPDFQEYFRTHMAMGVEEAMSNLVAYYQNDTFQPAIFDRLSRSFSGEGLSNHAKLLLTNCLDVSLSPLVLIHSGPTTCTLNHSCIANATVRGYPVSNDPSMLLAEVVAVKAIEAGTEITVPYQVFSDPTAERRLQPLEIYGFECVCDICMDDTARARDSYANINRLLEVVDTPLEDERKQRTPWLFFKAACELVDEYKRLGIEDKRYAQLFENCARVAAYHSDAIRTHKFLRFADVHWRMLRPTEVTRQLAAESIPEKHPQWGHTTLGLSSMQDNDLFRDRASAQDVYNRVMMTGYEESYDRIKPKEEAIAEEEILARKAADELVAEVEMEKGKQAAATPAKKVKKKRTRKQKAKKGATSGEGEDEESVGPILAAPDVRLNVGEAGRRQRAKVAPAAPVAKKEKKTMKAEVEPVAAAPVVVAAVEERKEGKEGEKREEVEGRGSAGFCVGDYANAGEEEGLGRMRAYSQPPPFSRTARHDEDPLVLPGVGQEHLRLCVAYLWSLLA